MENAESQTKSYTATYGDFRRKAMVFLIYLIFGPPIGGLVTIFGFFTYAAIADGAAFFGSFALSNIGELLMIPVWIAMLSLWGYLFGGAQAAMTGLILAACSDLDGRFGFDRAVIATFPPSIFAGILIGKDYLDDYDTGHGLLILVLTLASVAASVVVRYLFRNRFRVPRAPSP